MKKKLTLLLLALVTSLGAWADGLLVSTTESASAEYQYKIFCRNASTYYLGNTTNATNSGADYGLFAFFKDTSGDYTDGYYIYSIFEGKWVTYTPAASYTEGQDKISLTTEKPSVPWNIAADNTDNKYYDIRAFKTDKSVEDMSWNWHGGAEYNTSHTMGFYGYTDGNSGWGIVLVGGSGSPVADRKVVAIYNRTPNGNEYPITSSVNGSGRVLSSNSTSATPQLFVLRQNGIDDNGEAKYNLQKAEADGNFFSNDGTTPQANTYSATSSDFVFLNTSCPFISNYSAFLKDGTSIATSNYNLMARATYYGCIHSKNNNAVFDGWTSNSNSNNKIQFYYSDSDWNGLWSVKEQSYDAWQVVVLGTTSGGSVTYSGSALISGGATTQSNNGIYVLNATPLASNFTPAAVDGCCSDPTVSVDADRKLIKVTYVDYTESVNTLENTPIGIGYPSLTARTTLQSAIDGFNATSKRAADYASLYTACNTFNNTSDIALPETGKVYVKSSSTTAYLENVDGTLTISTTPSATALNNLWVVRSGQKLQSAADFTKYLTYEAAGLNTTGVDWTISKGTGWPYIAMYNSTMGGNGRYVGSNGSSEFGAYGTDATNYWGSGKTQASGWSTDFKFVESSDYALYTVNITSVPSTSSPTVTYNATAYSTGADFIAPTTLSVSDLTVTDVDGFTKSVSIDGNTINVTYSGFIRIKGVSSGKYMSGNTYEKGSGTYRLGQTSEANASTIFYLDGNKLLSYTTGYYATNTCEPGSLNSTPSTYVFTPDGEEFKIAGNGAYLYSWDVTHECFDRNGTTYATQCHMKVEKVTSLPITMHEVDGAYYATINLPVAVTLPSGLSAYSATASGDVLTLTKVVEGDVLAANQPVILYSESNVTSLDIASTAGTEAASNELSGTTYSMAQQCRASRLI